MDLQAHRPRAHRHSCRSLTAPARPGRDTARAHAFAEFCRVAGRPAMIRSNWALPISISARSPDASSCPSWRIRATQHEPHDRLLKLPGMPRGGKFWAVSSGCKFAPPPAGQLPDRDQPNFAPVISHTTRSAATSTPRPAQPACQTPHGAHCLVGHPGT